MKNTPMISKIHQFLSRLDLCTALILLVALIFTLLLLASNLPAAPVSAQSTPAAPTAAENPAGYEHPVTPIPEEYLANDTQTNGIVFGTVLLVLIVIGGTLSVMWRKVDPLQEK